MKIRHTSLSNNNFVRHHGVTVVKHSIIFIVKQRPSLSSRGDAKGAIFKQTYIDIQFEVQ